MLLSYCLNVNTVDYLNVARLEAIMKKYPGVFLTYFDLKNHELTRKLAEDLYSSSSSISLNLKIGKSPA